MDDERADEVLVAVFHDLVALGREAKQGAWAAPRGAVHDAIENLMTFLFARASEVADVEADIDGRSPEMISPSAHGPPTLVVDAHGAGGVVSLLIERVRELAADIRTRAAELDTPEVVTLLHEVADGLAEHLEALAATNDSRARE